MTLRTGYFDDMYSRAADPWGLRSRSYEARKYAITLAALPRERYGRAFEPGCSVGVLTRLLAERADTIVATDISETALREAGRGNLPANVTLRRGAVPDDWPEGEFDLIVFSELGYYLDAEDLDTFVSRSRCSLSPDGHLVAVHWRPTVAGYPGTAATVHARLDRSGLVPLAHYDDEHFLLDLYAAGDGGGLRGPTDG
ncbi:MAG TPA: class I SAM-dependent methyltransferase [Gaiellaceae bacterium]|jgi:SAM-dependent methyltransferase|nr:class I SAM-dependent methyltransferase [Gaiellaceae bacterium]